MFDTSILDPKIRFLVLFIDAQWSVRRISQTLSIPMRTVQDWISKAEEGIDIRNIQPGRGQKAKVPEATKKKLLELPSENPLVLLLAL